jgi:hypothetical protein
MSEKTEEKKVITELTPAQEAQLPVYKDMHLKLFFDFEPIPRDKATKFVNEVYKYCGLEKPKEIYIVQTPKQAQELANLLCGKTDSKTFEYYDFGSYVNAWDLGWLAYYKYVNDVLEIDLGEDFDWYYKGLTESRIYDSIQFDEACILVEMPSVIHKKAERLHCADGPAVSFGDGSDIKPRLANSIFGDRLKALVGQEILDGEFDLGYEQYYWEDVAVPKKLIMDTDNFDKKDIQKYESNAEIRRAIREVLGGKRYYDLLSDGDGVTLIDEDIDAQGYPMKLYETKMADSIIDRKVQFIEVTCPSTERVYNIYPPNQNSTNVWDAKASTFNNEKGKYRHGDVMLKKVDEDFDRPVQET